MKREWFRSTTGEPGNYKDGNGMKDCDETVPMADSDPEGFADELAPSGVDTPALECAASRAEQLARWRAKLAAGEPISEHDVAIAHRRVGEAHIRARRAHLAAAAQHRRTAQAHERAAQTYDGLAAQGIGDVEAHRRAAVSHRAARDDEYRAARDDDYRAAYEALQRPTLPGSDADIFGWAAITTGAPGSGTAVSPQS